MLSRLSRRLVPDPFVLALGLTGIVLACGWANLSLGDDCATGETIGTLLDGWFGGFANPGGLAFALQMCLVLVTGHALALSPLIQRLVKKIARIPRTTAQAALVVAFVSCLAAIMHWGLGAIVGALLAREITRDCQQRDIKLHYPLLGGAAYAGMAVWHGGLSGSAPLKVAEAGHFFEDAVGVVDVSRTLGSELNLAVTGLMTITIPLLFWALGRHKPDHPVQGPTGAFKPLPQREAPEEKSFLNYLHYSSLIGTSLGILGLAGMVAAAILGIVKFDLNTVNLTFLFLGLVLHGGIRHYTAAVADGARGAGAIVLQFPFYFAILGVMQASGLIGLISEFFVNMSSQSSFPVLSFFSAGLVNLFVPSGGGQWAVQGEILLRTGTNLGVDPSTTIMAFAYGDAWTNMLQPFWALPLLGIMGLRARDIIGYTAVVLFLMGVAIPALLLMLT